MHKLSKHLHDAKSIICWFYAKNNKFFGSGIIKKSLIYKFAELYKQFYQFADFWIIKGSYFGTYFF